MNGGMGRAQWLTQVRGVVAVGLYLFFSFLFCSGLSFSFHLSAGMKGSGGGAPPSTRLARKQRGIRSCHTLVTVHTV